MLADASIGKIYFLKICGMIRPLGHTTVEWSGTSSMTIAPAPIST